MRTTEDYELSKEQIIACKKIENAFKDAKAKGVRFIAKAWEINAYVKEAAAVMGVDEKGEYVPYYSLHNCIDDSGADDMECFPEGFLTE